MDAEVKALLQTWGLEEYTEIFSAMILLNETLAKELIGPVGDRAKFIKNLENFKKTLVPVTDPTFNENYISMTEDLSVKFVEKLGDKHRKVVPLEEVININILDQESEIYYSSTPKAASSPSRSSPVPGCSDTQTPTATTVTHSLHLEELLKSTAEGKSIINSQNEGQLSSNLRRRLTNLIIKHLLGEDPEKRIDSTVLMSYAQQIYK